MDEKMDKVMKLMGNKNPVKMSDEDIAAKLDVLKELLAMCDGELKGRTHKGMDGLKKVSVMADSPEGLNEGLEKAQELAQVMPEESDEDPMEEATETPEEEKLESAPVEEEEPMGYFARKKKLAAKV